MTALLTFMGSYWKYIVPFVIGGVIFGGAAWKIRGLEVNKVKADLSVCTEAKLVCTDANAENSKTITALQADIAKTNKSCASRINGKDQTIKRLKQIDELKPSSSSQKGVGNESDSAVVDSTGDAILLELDRMWKPAADSKKGIR